MSENRGGGFFDSHCTSWTDDCLCRRVMARHSQQVVNCNAADRRIYAKICMSTSTSDSRLRPRTTTLFHYNHCWIHFFVRSDRNPVSRPRPATISQQPMHVWTAKEKSPYPKLSIQFNSIQFYCKINMTERSQWTEYKINNQIGYTNSAQQSTIGYAKLSWGNIHLACTCTHRTVKGKIMPNRSFCTTCGWGSCSPKDKLNVQGVDMSVCTV